MCATLGRPSLSTASLMPFQILPHIQKSEYTCGVRDLRLSEGLNFVDLYFYVCFHRSTARNIRTPGGSWSPPRRAEDDGKWSLFNSACPYWSGLQNQKLTDYFSILVSDRDIEWKFRIIRESDLFFTSVNIQRYFVVRASCVWFGFLISCHENNAANVFPDNRRQRPITASGDQTCYKK